ncbi:permease [Megasphaera paucivorans]|uniref:Predicted permease n=1 Tax=Megasphaera paucivorans TaxID=349095 RepID=A0A1G9RNJ2_9FIRM|nr:permease [Megasphaera paucivorans]SDM24691.1 Predicted permease [Megasphaera paucivorans]
MKYILYRYKFVLLLILINACLYIISPESGIKSIHGTTQNLKEMMFIMPPIFILMGLLDVWIDKKTMTKFMGEHAGMRGVITALFIGSVAAGPGYMAFPFTEVLMKKNAAFTNILIFVGAWSATKIPISLFEASVMGWPFMILRYILDIPAIIIIAKITDILLSKHEKIQLYQARKKEI